MLNLKKSLANLKKFLDKNFSNFKIYYDTKSENCYCANLQVALKKVDMFVTFSMVKIGLVTFIAVFDKIEKTQETLNLINDFNKNQFMFTLAINPSGHLELRNSSFCDDESFLKTYGEQTMGYLGIYLEDKNQKELVKLVSMLKR